MMRDPVTQAARLIQHLEYRDPELRLTVREGVVPVVDPQCGLVPFGEQVLPETEVQFRDHPARRLRSPPVSCK
jgi:hypothetical protein